jgi:hypothetical protein
MTRYFEVTDRGCAARIGRLMLDQRIQTPTILNSGLLRKHHLLLNGESSKDGGGLGAARYTC